MTLLWIGDAVLLLVVLPIVVVLLRGVLRAVNEITAAVEQIGQAAAALSRDLDAAPALLTTQDQVSRTLAGIADYGGSLDVIVDDAPQEVPA
jgi:hypothetical protein